MHFSFLIPLCTGLVTGYVAKKSQDDIAYIISIFTIISLILSLILAPWQLQFLLLLVVLIGTNQLLRR